MAFTNTVEWWGWAPYAPAWLPAVQPRLVGACVACGAKLAIDREPPPDYSPDFKTI